MTTSPSAGGGDVQLAGRDDRRQPRLLLPARGLPADHGGHHQTKATYVFNGCTGPLGLVGDGHRDVTWQIAAPADARLLVAGLPDQPATIDSWQATAVVIAERRRSAP